MTSFRWVIQDPSFATARLQSHTISVTDGPASISQGPSTVQPGLVNDALMQALGSYKGDECSFWGLARAWAPP